MLCRTKLRGRVERRMRDERGAAEAWVARASGEWRTQGGLARGCDLKLSTAL